jgi:hypothetical protein
LFCTVSTVVVQLMIEKSELSRNAKSGFSETSLTLMSCGSATIAAGATFVNVIT